MIDFAAINIKVALSGINANGGAYILAFFTCEIAIFYTVFWWYVFLGMLSYINDSCSDDSSSPISRLLQDASTDESTFMDCGQGWYFLFAVLSFYWTHKVLMNTIEVTVAGVMATWCFEKDAASGFCSGAVASSLYRSLTFSFGSICLGSLLQGIVTLLRKIIPDPKSRRGNDQCCGLCFCVFECCGRVLEDFLDYFHQWAYVFVGIYGYSYLESGKRVFEMFQSKGWTSIITERLASYVLSCIIFVMGVVSGLSTLVLTMVVDSYNVDDFEGEETKSYVYGPIPWQLSFVVGFVVGAVAAAVMMSVVRGGVNTFIVCFADSPALLEENHPELTKEVIDAWSDAFPETISKHSFATPTAEPIPVSLY